MEYQNKKKEYWKKEEKKDSEEEKKEGKECPKCHTINELEAKFCEECGYNFGGAKKKKCPKCSTVNEPEVIFCEECGYKFFGEGNQEQAVKEQKKKEEVKKKVKETDIPKRVLSQNEELLKMKAYTQKVERKNQKKKKTLTPLFSDKQKANIKEMDKKTKEEIKKREEDEKKRQEEERKKRFKHFLKPIGNITFILTWEFSNSSNTGGPDIDMWIISPNSHRLSSSRDGYGLGPDPDDGKIDHDDTGDGTGGPERAFWPERRAPKGKYEYGVRYYGGDGNVNYQVNVFINGKCVQTKK